MSVHFAATLVSVDWPVDCGKWPRFQLRLNILKQELANASTAASSFFLKGPIPPLIRVKLEECQFVWCVNAQANSNVLNVVVRNTARKNVKKSTGLNINLRACILWKRKTAWLWERR